MSEIKPIDWVKVRSQCSLGTVFEILKTEVEADVAARNALRGPKPYYAFAFTGKASHCFVSLEANTRNPQSVTFLLEEKRIFARNQDGEVLVEATLTLNDDGDCKLKIGGVEKDSWHFRRKALERLFFESI